MLLYLSSTFIIVQTHKIPLEIIVPASMIDRQGASHLSGPSLVAAITSVCAAGFCLFGYDQGVMSGVVVSEYWLAQMGNPSIS